MEAEPDGVMQMSTASAKFREPRFEPGDLTSASDFMDAIRGLLASEEATAARRTAAQGADLFPEHSGLAQANRVLNPSRMTSRPATAPDRSREFAWLRRHGSEYRGRWVALLGDELLASSDELEDVLSIVRSRSLRTKPLVHHIE